MLEKEKKKALWMSTYERGASFNIPLYLLSMYLQMFRHINIFIVLRLLCIYHKICINKSKIFKEENTILIVFIGVHGESDILHDAIVNNYIAIIIRSTECYNIIQCIRKIFFLFQRVIHSQKQIPQMQSCTSTVRIFTGNLVMACIRRNVK